MRSIAFLLVLAPAVAFAQPKTLTLTSTAEIDATKGKAGDVVAIAPDVAVGITDDFTLSVVTSRFAVTGFRGSAGGGFCVTDACTSTLRNAGIEGMKSFTSGPLTLAAIGGFHALDLDTDFYGAKVGARARVKPGAFSAQITPVVIVALGDRGTTSGSNRDTFWVPLGLAYEVKPVTLGIGSGVKGIIDDVRETWEVPVGASVQLAIGSLTIGTSFVFGSVVGGTGDAMNGFDRRGVQVWISNMQHFKESATAVPSRVSKPGSRPGADHARAGRR